jgi:hypothetical protein
MKPRSNNSSGMPRVRPVEDGADVGHGGVDLAHVETTEAVGQPGELGKRGDVIIRALEFGRRRPREMAVEEEIGGFLAIAHEGLAGICVQTLDGARDEREIAPNQAGVGDADFENLTAEVELDAVEALVGAAEAEDGNVNRRVHTRIGPTEYTEYTEVTGRSSGGFSVSSVCSVGTSSERNTRLR